MLTIDCSTTILGLASPDPDGTNTIRVHDNDSDDAVYCDYCMYRHQSFSGHSIRRSPLQCT